MSQQSIDDNKKVNVESSDEILPGFTSLENFTKEGYKIFMEAIKNSNNLPNDRNWSFYNTHDTFKKIVNKEGNTILNQINSILRYNHIEQNIYNRSLEEKTELMIEANDVILERAANCIDELNGIRKVTAEPILIQSSAQLPINGSWNRISNATFSVSSSVTSEPHKRNENAIRLLTAKNILRPQKFFKDKIINSSKYPWAPRIKEKPNSLKPLAIFLEETENGEEYSHPYEFELEKFVPLQDQLKKETPKRPPPLEETPFIEIYKPEQIDDLVNDLRNCKEFAVDLEHHSYRSFMGITCLMQISTFEKDYIIDTLALRDKLHVLNEVFTKPTIVKIFHGADMDIKWLQRDLSIYVVNMFDTYQAAKVLGYSGLSLAYLMQKFCNFVPNKHFQLADWRIRPLPEELKVYAREDTHYLMYIYHMLKNELLDKANGQDNLLLSVINNSTKICQKRYFRPVLREDSHLDFYRKCKRLFDNRQLYALKELYKWRDEISREEDESTGYVLPNHMLLQISETLPREMQGILACCNPIPPLVRANLLEIHKIVLKAKEQPLEKPILKEDTRARGITLKISKINVDSPLHCPHDLTKTSEFRDDLPTLLGNVNTINLLDLLDAELEIEGTCSKSTIFDTPENSSDEKSTNANKTHKISFLGPFDRYKLVKPFIKAEEEKLAAEKATNEENVTQASPLNTAELDNRTDEERIESIREHFLGLVKQTIPVVQETQLTESLVEMGGSKKRKRDSLVEEDKTDYYNIQITIPNVNTDINSRKRKSSEMLGNSSREVELQEKKQNMSKRQLKRLNRQRNNQNHQNRGQNVQTNPETQSEVLDSAEHNSPHLDNSGKYQHTGANQNNSGNHNSGGNHPKSGFKNRRRGNKGNLKIQGNNQQGNMETQNESFTSYDYSSVDFRQFQGGAQVAHKQRQFKSSFKFKGKKKNTGKGNNNRSTTFGGGGKKIR